MANVPSIVEKFNALDPRTLCAICSVLSAIAKDSEAGVAVKDLLVKRKVFHIKINDFHQKLSSVHSNTWRVRLRFQNHNQKMIVAARAITDKKTLRHLS